MVVCFFKHKTAYEVRISDWSSGVCSSDLRWLYRDTPRVVPRRIEAHLLPLEVEHFLRHGDPPLVRGDGRGMDEARGQLARAFGQRQIGRASCRDRVCQYV